MDRHPYTGHMLSSPFAPPSALTEDRMREIAREEIEAHASFRDDATEEAVAAALTRSMRHTRTL